MYQSFVNISKWVCSSIKNSRVEKFFDAIYSSALFRYRWLRAIHRSSHTEMCFISYSEKLCMKTYVQECLFYEVFGLQREILLNNDFSTGIFLCRLQNFLEQLSHKNFQLVLKGKLSNSYTSYIVLLSELDIPITSG